MATPRPHVREWRRDSGKTALCSNVHVSSSDPVLGGSTRTRGSDAGLKSSRLILGTCFLRNEGMGDAKKG